MATIAAMRDGLDELAALLGDDTDLETAVRRLPDPDVMRVLDVWGAVRRLGDGMGATAAGEIAVRSERTLDSPLTTRLGVRTPAELVAERAGLDTREASGWVAVGEAIRPRTSLQGEALPPKRDRVADAIRGGAIAVDAARLIADTLDQVDHLAGADELAEVERILVDAASRMSRRDLWMLCRSVPDQLDADGAELREERLRELAGVRVVRRRNGLVRWVIDADPESAGYLQTAIDARTAPRRQVRFVTADDLPAEMEAADDRRTLGRRRLDALVGIAKDSLTHDSGQVAGAPVQVIVTIDFEKLRTGQGTGLILGVDEPVSATTIRRMASDAQIIPAVLGSEGEVLDQGRARRLATPAQRAALAMRDRGCAWPGCHAPPGWCEVAHIRSWIHGGPTDLANLILLCPFHHRRYDGDGWTIVWRGGIPWFVPPPHVDPRQTPRAGGPPPDLAA